ncbi:hypothetical protein DOTSEDRAFT_27059 [Dothistroma septosporum NZE10]|uniref:Uncharacterized protein n=1 Tax=Dothistroma septosporum (strain NZE10 / CBS 128990) TaxID=675120 RepID=N1PDF9_DOTSN|nr:hypothetical protein DOTSEDRAFT_27059 [Dothistroma septosporum NZE10]
MAENDEKGKKRERDDDPRGKISHESSVKTDMEELAQRQRGNAATRDQILEMEKGLAARGFRWHHLASSIPELYNAAKHQERFGQPPLPDPTDSDPMEVEEKKEEKGKARAPTGEVVKQGSSNQDRPTPD